MKKLLTPFLGFLLVIHARTTFAIDGDAGVLGGGGIGSGDYERCVTAADLRTGNLHLDDFPCIVRGMIDIFMGFAATISVIFIIIGAYQILYGAVAGDKSKGKETIKMALGGFALAACAWLIIKFILDNFS